MTKRSVDSVVQVPLVGNNGLVDYRWLSLFKALERTLPPDGAGDVVDGSATSYAPMVLFQGPQSALPGTAEVGSIYFALDTGTIYWANGGTWQELSEELTGDVLKAANSTVTSLATVFGTPGTFGSSTQVPRVTVDAKGRITNLSLETISLPPPSAGGAPTQLQFNNGGSLGGTTGITFSGGALNFTTPLPTFNNLSPLTSSGDILTHNGTNNIRLPRGADNSFLRVNGTSVNWESLSTLNDFGITDGRLGGITTGIWTGGTLSATIGSTTFNVAAGVAQFVSGGPQNPTVTQVSFGPFTGVTPAGLTTTLVTYVGINSSGSLVQQASDFTPTQRRSIAVLGLISHVTLTTITAVNQGAQTLVQPTNQLQDLMEAIGPLNTSGNAFSEVGANLQIAKSAGTVFQRGTNWPNADDPHNTSLPAQSPCAIRYRLSTGTQYPLTTNIDPDNYESPLGTLTPVGNNRYTIQHIFIFPSGNVRLQYGQREYSTMALAIAGITTENFVIEPVLASEAAFRCYLVVKKGTTALNNPADATFINVAKFGGGIESAAVGALTAADIIAALGYTPGTVSSVQLAGNDGISISGTNPITSTGTITLDLDNITPNSVALPLGSVSAPTLFFSGDTNTGLWSATAGTLAFSTAGVERMRLNSDGQVLIGNPTRRFTNSLVETEGTSQFFNIHTVNSTTQNPTQVLLRSRGTTLGSVTALQTSDWLGTLSFQGTDGTQSRAGALINAVAESNWSSNVVPTYLSFWTRPAASGGPIAERMRINSDGNVSIGGTPTTQRLFVGGNSTGAVSTTGILSAMTVQGDVTASHNVFGSFPSTAASPFTLTALQHFNASQSTFGAGSTVSLQYGFRAQANLIGAATNFAFVAEIPAAANRWNFYASGTAANFFAGQTRIGNTLSGFNGNGTNNFVVTGTDFGTSSPQFNRFSNDNDSSYLLFAKSRSATPGSYTAVQNGDALGRVVFTGDDGGTARAAAQIVGAADATPSTGIVPGRITFQTTSTAGVQTERMRITSTGAVGIGDNTPITGTFLNIAGNATGAATARVVRTDITVQSDVTTINAFASNIGTQAASFTLPTARHFVASQTTFGAGSTVTEQYGFWADGTLVGATNNYGFLSNIPAAAGRWNFYAANTAANFFAGQTRIGNTLNGFNGNGVNNFVVTGTDFSTSSPQFNRFSNDNDSSYLLFAKSRSATPGVYSIVQSGDALGRVQFTGDDGTQARSGASIVGAVDATPSAGIVPGRLSFNTANTSGSLVERMRINSAGSVGISNTSTTDLLHVGNSSLTGRQYLRVQGDTANLYLGQSNGTILGQLSGAIAVILQDSSPAVPLGIATLGAQPILLGTSNTEQWRFTAAGNIGVGTAAANWASTARAIDFVFPAFGMDAPGQAFMSFNLRESSPATWVHKSTDSGTLLRSIVGGGISVQTAPSASVGSTAVLTEQMRVTPTAVTVAGLLGVGTASPTAAADINSDTMRLRTARTPASASAAGNQGDICWDSTHLYVCIATNTWRRIAHATW